MVEQRNSCVRAPSQRGVTILSLSFPVCTVGVVVISWAC